MKNDLAKYFSTVFYLGHFPVAAGSFATALGGVCAGILYFHPWVLLSLIACVTVLGFLTSGRVELLTGKKDPSCIVIDELAGSMIAFFMLPMSWPVFWCAFFVFRAFDMSKIFPADRMESRPGATGVMMDDIMAGIYTNIIMQIAVRWAGII